MAEQEVEQVYEEFWKGIVEKGGAVDLDQVKRELFDYHNMLEEVPKVYCHVTGGLVSKPNTDAAVVISLADDRVNKDIDEATKELEEAARAGPQTKYPFVVAWSDEDGGYVATCPDFPGLSAFGDTAECALAEAKSALAGFVESMGGRGEELPEPRQAEYFRKMFGVGGAHAPKG